MWVRIQDKTALINSETFYITENEEDNFCRIENNAFIMGTYSTKEQALEVLDMIQACISKDFSKLPRVNYIDKVKLIHEIAGWGTQDCMDIIKDNFVFQMPPDGKVK